MGRYYDDFAHSGMEEGDDILHYGVLGMKWGIRRYQPYSYTGGSGKEVGEAKKLAKLSAKSAKLDKKINKLEKKRTNRFAIATNARVRGRAGDKQQKLIKKKEKIDRKIKSMPIIRNDPDVSSKAEKMIKATNKLNKLFDDIGQTTLNLTKTEQNRFERASVAADKATIDYDHAVNRAIDKRLKKR